MRPSAARVLTLCGARQPPRECLTSKISLPRSRQTDLRGWAPAAASRARGAHGCDDEERRGAGSSAAPGLLGRLRPPGVAAGASPGGRLRGRGPLPRPAAMAATVSRPARGAAPRAPSRTAPAHPAPPAPRCWAPHTSATCNHSCIRQSPASLPAASTSQIRGGVHASCRGLAV